MKQIQVDVQKKPWELTTDGIVLAYSSVAALKGYVKSTSLEEGVLFAFEQGKLDSEECYSLPVAIDGKLRLCVFVNIKNTKWRDGYATVGRLLLDYKIASLCVACVDQLDDKSKLRHTKEAVEGLLLGQYQFTQFKSDNMAKQGLESICCCTKQDKTAHELAMQKGRIIAFAQNMARDLANTPANHLTPKDVVAFAHERFSETQVDVKCYAKEELEDMNMGALLAVAQGSDEAPYLLELTLNRSKKAPLVLVGKGVTFDTGGISIKPSKSMGSMKGDMGGAAAVIACMSALEELDIKDHIKVLVPLVENMPSARAYKPGDVITARNGKTIEVINTDAEGRLILADALCWAQTFKPRAIVDIATLTGACSVALGDVATAVLGNDQKLMDKCLAIQAETGELLWQLPIYDAYMDYLKSDVADIKNCAENRLAGTASAALFLQQFVDDIAWIHVDIASTMEYAAAKGCKAKGMDGAGVRSLVKLCEVL